MLPNLPKLDPTKDEFDLVRAIEYTASPIHYIVGRDDTNTASAFITDLRNGTLSRDLNIYRGFSPQTNVPPKDSRRRTGATPSSSSKSEQRRVPGHLCGRRALLLDETGRDDRSGARRHLREPTPVYIPNTSFYMSNDTESQFALAVTGGYRGALRLPGGGAGASGSASDSNAGLRGCTSARTITFSTDSTTSTSSRTPGSIPTRRGCWS